MKIEIVRFKDGKYGVRKTLNLLFFKIFYFASFNDLDCKKYWWWADEDSDIEKYCKHSLEKATELKNMIILHKASKKRKTDKGEPING